LKKLIGSLVPQAQWLVDEIQTPPIALMLRKFLPTLPVRLRFKGKSICPPSKVLKKLDEAVHRRNDLVHAGKSPPSGDELEEMLSAIYDFLCVCDVYAGYGWAQRYISRVFKVFAAVPSARGCVLNGTGDSGTTLSGKRPQRPAKEETIAARAVAT
jgi:hypothetical protein